MSSWKIGNYFFFFENHPNSFFKDNLKIFFNVIISMFYCPPKKWGFSLKADRTFKFIKL